MQGSATATGNLTGPQRFLVGWAGVKKSMSSWLNALSLVVMDPVRGVGQALDAVEVGHVVVVGLG